jgi:hypothetical protein
VTGPKIPTFSHNPSRSWSYAVLAGLSTRYPPPGGRLPTRYSPVRHFTQAEAPFTFDLHVLGTPPAFVLSQDQTLHLKPGCRALARPLFYKTGTHSLPSTQPDFQRTGTAGRSGGLISAGCHGIATGPRCRELSSMPLDFSPKHDRFFQAGGDGTHHRNSRQSFSSEPLAFGASQEAFRSAGRFNRRSSGPVARTFWCRDRLFSESCARRGFRHVDPACARC